MKMHDQCLNVIDYFNGHLNEEEKKAFETHLEECPECKETLKELEELNGEFASNLPEVTVPENMENRVLANVFDEKEQEEKNDYNLKEKGRAPQKNKKYIHPSWLIGVAAALILSLIGNVYLFTESDNPFEEEAVEVMDITAADNSDMHAYVQLHEEDDGRQTVAFRASNFIDLEPGQVYQIWLYHDDEPHRAGTLVPNADGQTTVIYTLEDSVNDIEWDQIAVTVESSPHHNLPEGNVVMSSDM